MTNNRAYKEIDQTSFLKFAFKGQTPPVTGKKLTEGQKKVYDLTMLGLSPLKISTSKKITLGSVYDSLTKIREKGWAM